MVWATVIWCNASLRSRRGTLQSLFSVVAPRLWNNLPLEIHQARVHCAGERPLPAKDDKMSGERYSFDVPDNCINFKDMAEDDMTGVDSWFDIRAACLTTPSGEKRADIMKTSAQRTNIPRAIISPMVKSVEKNSDQENQLPAEGQGTSKEAPCSSSRAPGRVARRLSARQRSAQRRLAIKSKMEKNVAAASASKEEPPPFKKQKTSNNQEKLRENVNRGFSPFTPAAPKKNNPPLKGKSTEVLEIEKMQRLQQEVTELRRRNEESLKAAIAGPGPAVKKTATLTTKPVDFHFCTDERIKLHGSTQASTEYKEVDFVAALRRHQPSPARVAKGPTVTKPFNLSQGNKRKHEDVTSEYVPLAQLVENFQKRTPSRYHLRSKKEEEGVTQNRPFKARVTNPKSPCFETKRRIRPVTCKSTAELEAEEIAKLQQYKFKAQELNPRILEGGPILPKKPPVKEPTKPIGFNLEIEKRIQERESKKPQEEEEEETFQFRSRPCPTKILEDVVGVPEKKPLPPTVPQSPAFVLKHKVTVPPREEKEEEVLPVIKAKPAPHFGVPFKPKPAEHRQVEVCPFSFDSRDKERLVQKEKKIEELQKGEVPKFKALPLPHFDHINLPQKKVKSPTKPEPFQLAVDMRGAVRNEVFQHQLMEEKKQQKEAAIFKAQPSTVVHQNPFVPKKESRIISGPENFELATERRVRERREFEERLAALEAEKARLQEEARRIEEERTREEVARLREELVHKANPIRKYPSVEIKPSEQPLTVPKSPHFSDRFGR